MKQIISSTIVLGAMISGTFLVACNGAHKNHSETENNEAVEKNAVFACPMHPEVKGKEGDTCPKCGMKLEPARPANSASYRVQLHTSPQTVEAKKEVKLDLSIQDKEKNAALEIAHEKKLHLIVVSGDLSWFDHLHPEEQQQGNFVITTQFPTAGKYLLYADYKPRDAEQTVSKLDLDVKGVPGKNSDVRGNKFVSVVDGYTVKLENGKDFSTGVEQAMQVSIIGNGGRLTGNDLEQYLGAVAHIVLINRETKDYLHVHPTSDNTYPILGHTSFEKPGIYRIWVQFKIKEKIYTADFTVDVKQGKGEKMQEGHTGHQH